MVSDGSNLTSLVTSQALHQSNSGHTSIVTSDGSNLELAESFPMVECPPLSLPTFPDANQTGRPSQARRLPARFRDMAPEPPLPVSAITEDTTLVESDTSAPQSTLPPVILHVFNTIRTSFNSFGIARDYCHRPSYDPDSFVSADQLSKSHNDEAPVPIPSTPYILPLPPWPWKNMSIWRMMMWMMTGSKQKSEAEVTRLANMLQADNFNPHDLRGFNAHTEMKRFDRSESALDESNPLRQDGWREPLVNILVPTQDCNPDGNGRQFTIGGLFHRPLTAVIRAIFAGEDAKWFHLTPFRRIWRSPVTGHEQCIYDELYTSDVWNEAHDTLQKQRCDNGCKLERAIAGLMFWSDAMHLAQFGNASAWPVYLFFGNQSKYLHACPTSGACHPIAFIPTVSLEAYLMTTSKPGNLIICSPSIASMHYH